jgi:hypothetical protein
LNQSAKGFQDLAQLYEGSPTDLPEEIEALLPQIRAFLENPNSHDINQAQAQMADFETQLQTNGQRFVDFSLKNAPFPLKPHPLVEWTTTFIGAISTTYLATSLFVDSFQKNVAWGHKLETTALITAGFYAATYYGQKAFVEIGKWYKERKETSPPVDIQGCEQQLLNLKSQNTKPL